MLTTGATSITMYCFEARISYFDDSNLVKLDYIKALLFQNLLQRRSERISKAHAVANNTA